MLIATEIGSRRRRRGGVRCWSGQTWTLGSEDNVYVVAKVEVAQSSINVWNLPVDTQCRLYGHVRVVVAVAFLDLGDGMFLI